MAIVRPTSPDDLKRKIEMLEDHGHLGLSQAAILSALVDIYFRTSENAAAEAESTLADAYANFEDFQVPSLEGEFMSSRDEEEFAVSVGTALARDAEERLSNLRAVAGPQSVECSR